MAPRIKCSCGVCKTCKHREYMRAYYHRTGHAYSSGGTVVMTCEFCEQEFETTARKKAAGQKFCSRRCKTSAAHYRKNPRDSRFCVECGKAIPEMRGNAKWCSQRCANSFRRRERPEIRMRHELKKKYGLTIEDYELMLNAQGGACAICGSDQVRGFGKRMAVDHCHDTGKVRGILCGNCNRGIGNFAHDPELLEAASRYLRRGA